MRPDFIGLQTLVVQVTAVDESIATVIDSFGKHRTVRVDIRRGGGREPNVGETWILDRTLGEWTFSALYSNVPDVHDHNSLYLQLIGGTMEGDIDMDGSDILNSGDVVGFVKDAELTTALADYSLTSHTHSYLPLTGGILSGDLNVEGGGDTLRLKSDGSTDHVFLAWFARDAALSTRSAWMGFGSGGASELTIQNDLNNDIILRTAAGIAFFHDESDTSFRVPNVGSGGLATKARFPDGSQASPGIAFDADANTGFFRTTADQVRVSTGNNLSSIFHLGGFQTADGSEAEPGYGFHQDSDTGIRRVAGNTASLVAAGADVMRWISTAATVYSGTDPSWSGFTALERWAAHGQAGIIHACRSAGEALFIGRNTSNGSAVRFDRSGTQVGSISVTTTATAYNVSSDERLKKNIKNSGRGLEIVKGMRVREWDWKVDDSHGIGFVAQEMQQVAPEVVTLSEALEGEEPILMMDYGKITPYLAKAIQELDGRVKQLEGARS